MSDAIYVFLRALVRVALAIYFSRIELEGDEDVPEGPIVIAATHPNAFMDVALVATRLSRRVRFVAKAPLFRNPILGAFLRGLGAVPVERRMERAGEALEAGAQQKNAQSLSACEEAVAGGGAVLIFPEGTSEHVPQLLPLKTGVARIALGAHARRAKLPGADRAPGVSIVPVAVRYDDPTSFRSRARVLFLPAIPIAPYAASAAVDEHAAVKALTGAVRDALEPEVVHLEDPALGPIVQELDALYGRTVAAADAAHSRLAAAPAIALAVNAFAKSSPERVAGVRAQLEGYRGALAAAGVDDAVVRPGGGRPTPGQTVALVTGIPVALWGILHHWLPYQVPRLVVKAFVRDATFASTIKLITGTFAYLALYVAEGVLWTRFVNLEVGLAVALTLPVSGIVALEVIEALGARARRRRRRGLRAALPDATLHDLESRRDAIVRELDKARAEFLLARGGPAVEEGLA